MYIRNLILIISPMLIYKYRKNILDYSIELLFWFKNFRKNNKLINGSIIEKEKYNLFNYTFNNEPYILILDKHINFNYNLGFNDTVIEKHHNSINMVRRNTDIIMANLSVDNNREIDVIDTVKKICDPMCSFHENIEFKPKREHLINFFSDLYSISDDEKITKCEIMLCDGTEKDLLNID